MKKKKEKRNKVKMKTLEYVGGSVLDISKILIYEIFYDYIISKWGKNNVKLIYMDTCSLITLIKQMISMKILVLMM